MALCRTLSTHVYLYVCFISVILTQRSDCIQKPDVNNTYVFSSRRLHQNGKTHLQLYFLYSRNILLLTFCCNGADQWLKSSNAMVHSLFLFHGFGSRSSYSNSVHPSSGINKTLIQIDNLINRSYLLLVSYFHTISHKQLSIDIVINKTQGSKKKTRHLYT